MVMSRVIPFERESEQRAAKGDSPSSAAPQLTRRSQVPGRVRWHAPALHRQPRRAAVIEDAVSMFSGVQAVRANPLTGSILVHFDSGLVTIIALESAVRRALKRPPLSPAVWQAFVEKRRRHPLMCEASRPSDPGACIGQHDLAFAPAWHWYLDGTVLGSQLLRRFITCACAALVAQPLATIIMGVSTLVTGLAFLRHTGRTLSTGRQLSANSIIGTGTVIRILAEQNIAALAAIWMFHLVVYLRSVARRRSPVAARITPEVEERDVWMILDGVEVCCSLDRQAPGDVIVLDAGERVPIDGCAEGGGGTVDELPFRAKCVPVFGAPSHRNVPAALLHPAPTSAGDGRSWQ
jgi:cation transport ATPase